MRWSQGVYRFARTIGTRFGWFPEFVGKHACETCGITDMIDIAIQLARSGRHECWGDAERFGRNHLAESQFIDADWERQVPKLAPADAADFIAACPPPQLKREGVRDVLPGAFSGGSAPNGVVDTRRGHWWMGCCNAHGVHGLFLLWHHAVRATRTAVRVNLLFDRSTPWADVRSHLPAEGTVEVVMRQGGSLSVRTPDGAAPDEVSVDAPGRWRWNDGYVQADGLAPGQVVTIRFPLREHDERVRRARRRVSRLMARRHGHGHRPAGACRTAVPTPGSDGRRGGTASTRCTRPRLVPSACVAHRVVMQGAVCSRLRKRVPSALAIPAYG